MLGGTPMVGELRNATKKDTTMRKLQLLTAAAAVLLALTGPSLAAKRTHQDPAAYSANAADRSGAYYYGPRPGYEAYGAAPGVQGWGNPGYSGYSYGQNLPYPDRPYGDPDSW
jgi:hypothetical protein